MVDLHPIRSSILSIAEAGLPGLVHFGSDPLCLYPEKPLKRLKLLLPGEAEILNLSKLKLHGNPPDGWGSMDATMSPAHVSSGSAVDFLNGGRIETKQCSNPYWQVVFGKPQTVLRIDLVNRLGIWGGRSYGICAEIEHDDGSTTQYDHLAEPRLLTCLSGIARSFCEFVDVVLEQKSVTEGVLMGLSDCQYCMKALLKGLRSALMGGNVGIIELADLRSALVSRLVALFQKIEGKSLQLSLEAGCIVINALLWKARVDKKIGISALDLELLSIAFAARIVRYRRASLDVVNEHQRFLTTAQDVAVVERRVNDIVVMSEIERVDMPVMFRAHGMCGSPLLSDAYSFVKSLKQVEALLASLGYESCICYGTFLGSVREKTFIAHDDDVDMAVLLRGVGSLDEELDGIVKALVAKGARASFCQGFSFIKVCSPDFNRFVDVFPIAIVDDERVLMYMQQLKLREVPRHAILPFGTVEFYGEVFACPADTDGFLTERYGPTWRVPQRIVGGKMLPVDVDSASLLGLQ